MELLEESGEKRPDRLSCYSEFVCRNLRKKVSFPASGPAVYLLKAHLVPYRLYNLVGYITSLKGLRNCAFMYSTYIF
jgi:hypothetical protein